MQEVIGLANTTSRKYRITCVGDSDAVADMLEDISKHIRDGCIHCTEDSFYEFESYAYVKERNRLKNV